MTFYFPSSISLHTFMSVYEGVLVTILHLVVAVLNLLGALAPGLLRPQVLRGPLLPGSQHARLLQKHDSGLHHGEGLALPPGCPGGQRARPWEMETGGFKRRLCLLFTPKCPRYMFESVVPASCGNWLCPQKILGVVLRYLGPPPCARSRPGTAAPGRRCHAEFSCACAHHPRWREEP
ncbi:g-protein coupled receptor [Lynx pardinus]|uniref:G-protein coupled receptor n=1 Tax=Lynx pardinus TaxID=191816 RepID=A0A485N8G8_LYNPA|nr:g-protein coupled receptor [Lynx pardinus]